MGIRYFLIFLMALTLSSCNRQDNQRNNNIFNWNIHAPVTSLDPAFARAQNNIWATLQIYNTLVELDDDLNIRPSLAHSWEIDGEGTTYTFFLRNDVHFHDHQLFEGGKGRKMTAHDVAFSLNRIIDPQVASPGAWIFNDKIEIITEGNRTTGSFLALNDTTLQIKLLQPFPPFLGLLSMQYCSVVPQEIAEHFGRDFRNNAVGTGPFMQRHWDEGNRLVLERNPNYWETDKGSRLPHLDMVNISFIENRQNEFFAFLKGDLHMVTGVDPAFRDHVFTRQGELSARYRDDFIKQQLPFLNTEYLGFTQELEPGHPLLDKRVRQAINMGFDRNRMLRFLRNNMGKPGTAGFVPAGLPSFDPEMVKGFSYDPQRAAQLLAESGYPNGSGLPMITIYTNQNYLDIALFMQSQLAELGIRINVEVNPPSTHREWMVRGQMEIFRGSWIADYPDAENYLALFYSPNSAPNGPNYTRYKNPEFDRLYEQARLITNDEERFALYHQMENMLIDDSPVIVLYYDETVRLLQKNVSGLPANAINLINLKRVKVND